MLTQLFTKNSHNFSSATKYAIIIGGFVLGFAFFFAHSFSLSLIYCSEIVAMRDLSYSSTNMSFGHCLDAATFCRLRISMTLPERLASATRFCLTKSSTRRYAGSELIHTWLCC